MAQLNQAIITGKRVSTVFGDVNGESLTFSVNGMDRRLESQFPHIFHGRALPFIELGANDGFNQSNTLYFEMKYGLKGILIEALPSKYEVLLTTRALDNHIRMCAAVPTDYPSNKVTLLANNLMSVADIDSQCAENRSDLGDIHSHVICEDRRYNYEVDVPALTLQSVIEETDWRHFSLLSLDVEGNELSVLQGIDFSEVKFELILIESRDVARIKEHLASVGYRYLHSYDSLNHLFQDANNCRLQNTPASTVIF